MKFTLVAASFETFATLTITTGFIVVESVLSVVVRIDVDEVDVVELIVVDDMDEVEDVEEVDVVEVVDTDVEGGCIITPPLLPPPPLETVVVAVDVVEVDVEDIATVLNSMLFTVTGVDAESVINTLAETVFPKSAFGTCHRKVLDVPVIPVYSAFASRLSVIELNI